MRSVKSVLCGGGNVFVSHRCQIHNPTLRRAHLHACGGDEGADMTTALLNSCTNGKKERHTFHVPKQFTSMTFMGNPMLRCVCLCLGKHAMAPSSFLRYISSSAATGQRSVASSSPFERATWTRTLRAYNTRIYTLGKQVSVWWCTCVQERKQFTTQYFYFDDGDYYY